MAVHNEHCQFEIATGTAAETANTDVDYYKSMEMPGKYLIKKVVWVSDVAVTADAANYSDVTLTNATTSQTIATRSYLAPTFGNSTAGGRESLTLPTGIAAVVNEGDVLKLAKTTPGTGAVIRGRFILQLERWPL